MTIQRNQTTFKPRRSVLVGAMAVLVALAVSGCAAVKPEPPELQVRKLATQRWQALLAGNFDKAYEFATPAYRLIHTADAYRAKRQATPVKWVSAEVHSVACQEVKCDVKIHIQSKPMVPTMFKGVIDSGVDEVWVMEDGQWWMLEGL